MQTTAGIRGTMLVALGALAILGCGGDPESDGAGGGGKADQKAAFQYGIYQATDFDMEKGGPLFVAFHQAAAGQAADGNAGQYDYSVYDLESETTTHTSGNFKLLTKDGQATIALLGDDGSTQAELPWQLDGRKLSLGEHQLSRLEMSYEEKDLMECEAFDVLELAFEESFTVWEYPTVSVERVQNGYDVSIGGSAFSTADGDTISVDTNSAGGFEAKVVTSYGSTILVQVPAQAPLRGTVLYAENAGEAPHEMASLVCYPRK